MQQNIESEKVQERVIRVFAKRPCFHGQKLKNRGKINWSDCRILVHFF